MIEDPAAEADLLGAVMRDPRRMEDVLGYACSDWFYRPEHAALWRILTELWAKGEGLGLHGRTEAWDHWTVRNAWTTEGRDGDRFDDLTAKLVDGAPYHVNGLLERLETVAYRRRMAATAAELTAASDSDDTIGQLSATAEKITDRLATKPRRRIGISAADFAAEPDNVDPWVIPGVMRAQWRALVVAAEGRGKSVCLRQMGLCTALGIHPFTGKPMPAQPTLIVDVENPRDHLRSQHRALWNRLLPTANTDDPRVNYALEPGGLDLRTPEARATLEAEMRDIKPRLMVIGPLYKLYSRDSRETDEQAAIAVQRVLDQLRTRFGCALIIEHHAPHKEGFAAKRNMRPFGSSAWLRWPELGIGLVEDDEHKGSLLVDRFRGDRATAAWPDRLDRGTHLPWTGWWANGIPDRPEA